MELHSALFTATKLPSEWKFRHTYCPILSEEPSAGRQLSFITSSHSKLTNSTFWAEAVCWIEKQGFSILPKYTLTGLDGYAAKGPLIGPRSYSPQPIALGHCSSTRQLTSVSFNHDQNLSTYLNRGLLVAGLRPHSQPGDDDPGNISRMTCHMRSFFSLFHIFTVVLFFVFSKVGKPHTVS